MSGQGVNNSAAGAALHLALQWRSQGVCNSSAANRLPNQHAQAWHTSKPPVKNQTTHNQVKSAQYMAAQTPTTHMPGQVRLHLHQQPKSSAQPSSVKRLHSQRSQQQHSMHTQTAANTQTGATLCACFAATALSHVSLYRYTCRGRKLSRRMSQNKGMRELLSEVCVHVPCECQLQDSQAPSAHPQHTGHIPQWQLLPWLSCIRCLNSTNWCFLARESKPRNAQSAI
jgi:hypothetical protein